jgi:hypothetical protein
MAAHTEALVQARLYRDHVTTLRVDVLAAVASRRFSLLGASVNRAEELKRGDEPAVLDAKALHAKLKVVDEAVRLALLHQGEGGEEAIDAAIGMAHDLQASTKAVRQALIRVEEDLRLEITLTLGETNNLSGIDERRKMLKQRSSSRLLDELGSSLKSTSAAKLTQEQEARLTSALARARKLKVPMRHSVFKAAERAEREMGKRTKLLCEMQKAYDSKDEDKMRLLILEVLLEKLDESDIALRVQNYLDQLPTDREDDDVRIPLK